MISLCKDDSDCGGKNDTISVATVDEKGKIVRQAKI